MNLGGIQAQLAQGKAAKAAGKKVGGKTVEDIGHE